MTDARWDAYIPTVAQWDAYIRSASNFAVAQKRMEEAVAAGVDFTALLREQAA